MDLLIHADDYGLTRLISSNIDDCIDDGTVNSISVIVNGHVFEDAVERLGKNPAVRVSVHLNLAEGPPVASPDELFHLVDDSGKLVHSFGKLWAKYLFASSRVRLEIRQQITLEFAAQIKRAVDAGIVHPGALRVDSHGHYHMIPFVFDSLLAAIDPYPDTYVRMPREPWQWPMPNVSSIRNYIGPNILKHVLLNLLSIRASRKIAGRKIVTCDYWMGALYSGNMSVKVLARWLAKVEATAKPDSVIEATFHPGGSDETEAGIWVVGGEHHRFYLSDNRKKEAEELKSTAMRALLDRITT